MKRMLVFLFCVLCISVAFGENTEEDPCVNGHAWSWREEEQSCCLWTGLTGGIVCDVCGAVQSGRETIPLGDHNWKYVEETQPTCWNVGKTAGVLCTVCKEVQSGRDEIPLVKEMTGSCTESISWKVTDDGTLYIIGNGEMPDYEWLAFASKETGVPWREANDHLRTVVVGEGITRIGTYSFADMKALESITVPPTLVQIGAYAFSESSLHQISLPDGLQVIEKAAFYISKLSTITIPDSVTNIGGSAFAWCKQLKSAVIGDGITQLKGSLFSECSSLTSIQLPNGLKSIQARVFNQCTELDVIELPAGVTLGDNPFCGTHAQISFIGQEERYHYDGTFLIDTKEHRLVHCSNTVTEATIPGDIITLGEYAFYHSAIQTIQIPKTIKDIGQSCFQQSALTGSLSLPDGLELLGYHSFANCDSLTELHVSGFTKVYYEPIDPTYTNRLKTTIFAPTGSTMQKICESNNLPYTTEGEYIETETVVLTLGDQTIQPKAYNNLTLTFTPDEDGFYLISYKKALGDDVFFGFRYMINGQEKPLSLFVVDEVNGIYQFDERNLLLAGSEYSFCFTAYNTPLNCDTFYFNVTALGSEFSGTFGDDGLTWSMNADGLFTISGNGQMPIYYSGEQPWSYINRFAKKLVVEEGITRISEFCLPSITEVELPSSLYEIAKFAFYGCHLESLTIPDGVQIIGYRAMFYVADTLYLPGSIIVIEAGGLGYDDTGTNIYAPEGSFVMEYCQVNGLNWTSNGTKIEKQPRVYEEDIIKDYVSGECGSNLRWTLDCYGNMTISGTGAMTNWFLDTDVPWAPYKYALRQVTIENGVTSIGSYAFGLCPYLYHVSISDSVTSIEPWAFGCGLGGNNSLSRIDIPGSVREIGEGAFFGCYYLKPTLHSGLEKIGKQAFSGCGLFAWQYIDLPNTVTSIGTAAFAGCIYTLEIHVPASVQFIAEGAFENCGEAQIILDDNNPYYCQINGVLYTADGTVLLWYPLGDGPHSFTVPDGVTRIGDCAFTGRAYLTGIVLPESLVSIGVNAFEAARPTQITIPASVSVIGKGAFSSNTFSQIIWEKAPRKITESLFSYSRVMSKIVIPEGVEIIGSRAFEHSKNLVSVTLPSTLRFIEKGAFFDVPLQKIYYQGTEEMWKTVGISSLDNYGDDRALLDAEVICLGEGEKTETVTYLILPLDNMSQVDLSAGNRMFCTINEEQTVECLFDQSFELPYCANVLFSFDLAPGYYLENFNVKGKDGYQVLTYQEQAMTNQIIYVSFKACPSDYYAEYPYVAPTCTQDGNVAYKQCDFCKRYYDENGNELIDGPVLPATGIHIAPDQQVCLTCATLFQIPDDETVWLPSSLKRIEESVFSFTSARAVMVHEQLEYLAESAFDDMPNLEYLFVPIELWGKIVKLPETRTMEIILYGVIAD